MPNWALEAYETLTLASDIKLLNYLVRHRLYRDNTYSTKQLAIALEIDLRTTQAGLARLAALGYVLSADGQHCACNALAKLPQRSCKSTRVESEKSTSDTASSDSLNKGSKEVRNKEQKQQTRAEEPAPVVEVPTPKPARKTPALPSGFQLIFASIALACYGGAENLTNEARGRVGKAAKSLATAGYSDTDIPQVVAWIRTNEAWRSGPLAPATLAERAPAWKAGLKGNLPLTGLPARNRIDAEDWSDVEAEQEATIQRALAAVGGTR
ncbi:hypothetical protein [Deinococcus peraridilitoris]|uniref:Uncharacterized protein n=1 Tax=Deinococcus peraridilitoris (strain DSM 19664 / LMG 22246 / CIP 109416 / KR-200) TaxID=937777 RepID=L0A2Y8_DEIPD|nr:hypothetical protein [Deinococcus peraridilitoris]AFZ67547.1 hypothetical protein Deipe_2051 [Deinococcus peraridilitoris DSM 19664]